MASKKRNHALFWGSSYDRGLDVLLFMWPDIKEAIPDALLHVCYGWDMFDLVTRTNPERKQWKQQVESLLTQPGIIHHGRIGKEELEKVRSSCGIWAFPTYFTEINCITALECQQDGVVPVTMNLGALPEVVKSGVLLDGDIKDLNVAEKYKIELISLMTDDTRWKALSIKAKQSVKEYTWEHIAKQWEKVLTIKPKEPLLTIITPTIREGWFSSMMENLSEQTYKNIQWIIIDDHPKDHAEIYREKHFPVTYLRGDLGKNGRTYALARANNMAWKNAVGEVLVFLQDFIYLEEHALEDIAMFYNHHPNDLLAPVDIYYDCIEPEKDNAADWFRGLNYATFLTKESWRNPRVKYDGLHVSSNPFDFEMNFGCIPVSVVNRLNGWYEFFDDGMGYDNTEIAARAMETGSKLFVDDSIIASCVNLWPHVKGTAENIVNREFNKNSPRWSWFIKNNVPAVRDEQVDAKIKLTYTIPSDVPEDKAAHYIYHHSTQLAKDWKSYDHYCQSGI